MRFLLSILALTMVLPIYSQSVGQTFCGEFDNPSYFPIEITKKKLLWGNTYYFEELAAEKEINNKTYIEFTQTWQSGDVQKLYLREENGVIYQYEECCESETVRFDPKLEEGDVWMTADGKSKYTLLSYKGTLKTPFCDYKDLMVIKAEFVNTSFIFYYKKGYGYIGATDIEDNLISCASPKW